MSAAQQQQQQGGSGPVVMDALAILGLANADGAYGDDDGLDDGEEETFACNNTGTKEDRDFDNIIGVLEDIMVSDEIRQTLDTALQQCPAFGDLNDHERYQCHKAFLARIEAIVDAGVARAVPHLSTEDIARTVKEREHEVSDEVFELVNGACMSYEQFAALWQARDKARGSAAAEAAAVVPGAA